jgi:hypothetical protein
MTGNLVVDLAISLAGIVILVGVSFVFGGWRTAAVTEDAAKARLRLDEPDFVQKEWMIGVDGGCAAAVSGDRHEIALVFAVGDKLASRRFRRGAVSIEKQAGAIIFRMKEPSLRKIRLLAANEADVERWLLRLAGPRL